MATFAQRKQASAGTKVGAATFIVLGFVTYLVLITLASGFVLQHLWEWFVVTTLRQPALSLGQAIGLGLVVRFMTYQYPVQEGKPKGAGELVVAQVAILVGMFVIGWLVHLAM